MNNTPNNNQEDFQAYSLGSMDQVNVNPSVPPVVPVESVPMSPEMPIESLDMNEPVGTPAVPIAPVEPVSPTYDVPKPINQFETPVFNNIGTVPPPVNGPIESEQPRNDNNQPKKKKSINKTTFIIVIILALVIVACVVYVLLNQGTTKKASITLKEVSIEMGSEISSDINDYAQFNNMNASACTLNTSNIKDTNTYNAEYTFVITCNGTNYTGKAKIVDTISPVVKVKDVTTGINKEVKPEDFIDTCEDATNCTYAFKDTEKVKENIKEKNDYKVDIIVKDGAGNTTEVTVNLKVSDVPADYYLAVSKEVDGHTEKIKFGIVDNVFTNTALRLIIFDFSDNETEYNNLKETSKESDQITYKDFTGKPEFDDEAKTMTFTSTSTFEELNKEFNTTLPETTSEMKNFFKSKGYEKQKFEN